ncbi:tellurite resistance TerB family protein [Streptomyces sp. CNQ085]|uniref:tellurite resistance TerB family protein n=1 Tax=Streptomyces sp. CNQ085 TaxID=2886944 RepID=UPI001F50F26C|nr:TerB family tellurite resistance protein [Streptomyces sp. CNQ085]MCI0386776.1 TerB family tellurite resistance protein [Streptomyces sp. CNQ085]
MALWNRLKESARTMQARLEERRNELRGGAFRDASMAMCALVAAADGTVDPAERRRAAYLIAHNEVLRNFPADELRSLFEERLDAIAADRERGRTGALQEIARVRRKPLEARAVVQIGIVIGGADGRFDLSERAVVREVCQTLDLSPHEFDL